MTDEPEIDIRRPSRVLITGGRETGGVRSFAEALRAGFQGLGIAAEVIPPSGVARRWRQLRNPRILKILSTSAVFAAPVSRRALCMAHGFPCAALQGWRATLGILASLKLATSSRGTQLVAVSEYSALQLRIIYGLRVDAVILNPVHPLFLEATQQTESTRQAITYVGRLHKAKNLNRMLPAIRDVLDENPGMVAWIAGDGPLRPELERAAGGDRRIEFLGVLTPAEVRERLRRSRVFVSGSPTEPFGIVYVEALSQGCAVVMPGSGGGLEIAPALIGSVIHLFPSSVSRIGVACALRQALHSTHATVPLEEFAARAVAKRYLAIDRRFDSRGVFHAEAAQ